MRWADREWVSGVGGGWREGGLWGGRRREVWLIVRLECPMDMGQWGLGALAGAEGQ